MFCIRKDLPGFIFGNNYDVIPDIVFVSLNKEPKESKFLEIDFLKELEVKTKFVFNAVNENTKKVEIDINDFVDEATFKEMTISRRFKH